MKQISITDKETLAMIYSIVGEEPEDVKYTIRLLWYVYKDFISPEEAIKLKNTKEDYINGKKEIVEVK